MINIKINSPVKKELKLKQLLKIPLNGSNLTKKPKKKNSPKNKKKLKIFIPPSLPESTKKPVDLKVPVECLEVCPEECPVECPVEWTPLNSLNKLKEDKDLPLMM
jgi:hypothetical protein